MEETTMPIEIDVEEMPKILQSSPGRFSESYDAERNQDYCEEDEVLKINIESQEELIKQLSFERQNIIKERDEMFEEYEDELKVIKSKNEQLLKENIELKQEVKILYAQVENFKYSEDFLNSLQKNNNELKAELSKTQQIISELQETNRTLTKSIINKSIENTEEPKDGARSTMKDLFREKDKLLEKFIEIDSKYSEKLREIDELRDELVFTKLKYAESETMKNLIYKKLIDKSSVVS